MEQKSRAVRLMRHLAISAVFAASVYFGTVEHMEGAKNIAVFMVWVMFFTSLTFFSHDVVEALAALLASPAAPVWLDATVDVILLGCMVWHGWIVTSVAFVIVMLNMGMARFKARKLLADRAVAQGAA